MAHNRTSTFATVLGVALFLALAAVLCPAAEPPVSVDQQTSLLGVGDWVTIEIAGQPDTTSVYVGADGTITVPLVGTIPVAGIPPTEAANRVTKALKDGGYFVDPQVTVQVTQQRSQSVSVLGDVTAPGRYPITPQTTVVELLAQAGGVKETGSDIGYVLRKDDAGRVNTYPVTLNLLPNSKDAPLTFALRGGDSLVVPHAERFSIEGEVTTPGRYRVEPGMTVMQAIARAGGITERGSEHRIQVKRANKPGQYQTIHAKLGDLVKADDIIRVKESIF